MNSFLFSFLYEIIYSAVLSNTVSAADEMDLVNAKESKPILSWCWAQQLVWPAKSLKVDDEVKADSLFWYHSAFFFLGTI